MNVMSQQEERTWAMLCHLSALLGHFIPFGNIVAPLLLWQIKKNESDYVDYHGKEALNFQITLSIYLFISAILVFVAIGFLMVGALLIFNLVIVIIAGVRANEGEYFCYPMNIRFIK